MHRPLSEEPTYGAAVEALQALADATGQAWILTNLDTMLGAPEPGPAPVPVLDQPCILCGEVH